METYLFLTLAGMGWMLTRKQPAPSPLPAPSQNQAHAPGAQQRQGQLAAQSRQTATVTGDVPSMRTVYDSRFTDHAHNVERKMADRAANESRTPISTGRIPGARLDARPQTDPAASAASHAPPSAAVGGAGANTFISPLTGLPMPLDQFTHNNMVPYFGGSVKQNVDSEVLGPRLEAFTGASRSDVRYQHKEESAALFKPHRTFDPLLGGVGDDLRDAYLASMPKPRNMANQQPAPQLVGRPGIVGGETGDVYYVQRRHAYQPTVDQLRAASRPKLTFEGRVLPPAAQGVDRPQLPSVVRQANTLVKHNTAADMLPTTGAVTGPTSRPATVMPCTSRAETSGRTYIGPGGSAAVQQRTAARAGASHVPFRACLSGPQPGPVRSHVQGVTDYGKAGTVARPTVRQDTGMRIFGHQGIVSTAVKALIAPIQDALRTTRKEEMTDAPRTFGNVQQHGAVQPRLTVYDANDVARTTLRETGAAEVPSANLRVTQFRPTVHDPADTARTARKETLIAEAALTNLYGANVRHVLPMHNPDDAARTARKETQLHDALQAGGVLRATHLRGPAYDPDATARTTVRETVAQADPVRNPAPVNGPAHAVQDPETYVASFPPTHRDMQPALGPADHSSVSAAQTDHRAGGYVTAEVSAPHTLREVIAEQSVPYGNAAPGAAHPAPGGYGVAANDVKDTQRQVLSDMDYYGSGTAAAAGAAQISHASSEAMTIRGDKQVLAMDGRAPGGSGAKQGASLEAVGQATAPCPQRAAMTVDMLDKTLSRPAPGEANSQLAALGPLPQAGQDGCTAAVTATTTVMGQTTQERQLYGDDSGDRLSDLVQGANSQAASNPYLTQPLAGQ